MSNKEIAAPAEILIVKPGEAQEFWQPVPANGYVAIHVAPRFVAMDTPLSVGTQTIAPGCYVREHVHDRHEEVIHCLRGEGHIVIDDVKHRLEPGMTIFLGKNHRHSFINDSTDELQFLWFLTPSGLENFFEAIGRPKTLGQAAPEPFPRPTDILDIERRTVFAPVSRDERGQ